eukprot:350847-Chlamydomonas_euryale.AAC.4
MYSMRLAVGREHGVGTTGRRPTRQVGRQANNQEGRHFDGQQAGRAGRQAGRQAGWQASRPAGQQAGNWTPHTCPLVRFACCLLSTAPVCCDFCADVADSAWSASQGVGVSQLQAGSPATR